MDCKDDDEGGGILNGGTGNEVESRLDWREDETGEEEGGVDDEEDDDDE